MTERMFKIGDVVTLKTHDTNLKMTIDGTGQSADGEPMCHCRWFLSGAVKSAHLPEIVLKLVVKGPENQVVHEPGAVVRLRSGGRQMVVSSLTADGTRCTCRWIWADDLHQNTFEAIALDTVDS